MESIIHKSFRDVCDFDACAVFEGAHVEDEFVRDESFVACVEQVEVVFELVGHIVGVEDRDL